MARYEGSSADEANDRRQAKKRGMTLTEWENSDMDKREDAQMQAKLDAKEAKMGRDKTTPHTFQHRSTPDHNFAHKRPVT